MCQKLKMVKIRNAFQMDDLYSFERDYVWIDEGDDVVVFEGVFALVKTKWAPDFFYWKPKWRVALQRQAQRHIFTVYMAIDY